MHPFLHVWSYRTQICSLAHSLCMVKQRPIVITHSCIARMCKETIGHVFLLSQLVPPLPSTLPATIPNAWVGRVQNLSSDLHTHPLVLKQFLLRLLIGLLKINTVVIDGPISAAWLAPHPSRELHAGPGPGAACCTPKDYFTCLSKKNCWL